MAIVRIPKNAVTKFDLPAVCVVTGGDQGVTYKPITFQWVPLWARLSVAFCGIIGLIAMLVSTKRVRAEMPFNEGAYGAWKRKQWIGGGLVLASFPVLLLALLEPEWLLLGLGGFFALFVAGLAYLIAVARRAGPMCREIDDTHITLELPSEAAAQAFSARLGLDAAALPGSSEGLDEYDARIDEELSRL